MILVSHEDAVGVLTPTLALDAMRHALDEQHAGAVQMAARQTTDSGTGAGGLDKHTGANWLRISAAFLNHTGVMGFKAMNRAAGLGMRYVVGLYDIATGELLALLDANEITTARTAATSALGTHLLADPASVRVGILGSGVQARALLRTYALLRELDEVLVFSPTPSSREAFAADMTTELGLPVRSVAHPEQAAEASTVMIAVRATREPVFLGRWLRPGMHVTGLSSVRHDAREVDDDTWARADLVVVDDRVNVAQSGDGRSLAMAEVFDLERAPELFEAHAGTARRSDAAEVTLFKSVGNAMQDIVVADAVFRAVRARGRGRDVGGFPIVKPYA